MAVTLQAVRNRLQKIRGGSVVQGPLIPYPQRIEDAFAGDVRRRTNLTRRRFSDFVKSGGLAAALDRGRVNNGGFARFDDAEDEERRIMLEVDEALALGFALASMRSFAEEHLSTLDDVVQRGVMVQLEAMNVPAFFSVQANADLLNASIRDYVGHAEGVATAARAEIRSIVISGLKNGLSTEVVANQIRERLRVAQSKATFWARNDLGTARAHMIRIRHQQSGVNHYRWWTEQDELVRPRHAAVHGQIFSYSNPPAVGSGGRRFNPGEDYHCRCDALPVMMVRAA